MGFGAVIDMADRKLPRRVLLWLIKKVDCKTMSLVLKNHRISILDVVEEILKFPVGELDVDMPPAGNHRDKAFIKFNKFRSEKVGRGQPLREEEELLVTYTEPADKDKFWFSFMEVLLCSYLAPTTRNIINRSYVLGHCQIYIRLFAVKYLIRDINEIRVKTVENINLQGCLHILIVMYVDLVKRTHIVVQEGIPCIKFFTNESLEDLASLCRKRNRNDDQFFEELLDNNKLSQFPLVESNNEPKEKDPDSEDEVPPSPTKKKKYSKREIKENSSEPVS